MITLIGIRCTHSNVFSRDVLIRRILLLGNLKTATRRSSQERRRFRPMKSYVSLILYSMKLLTHHPCDLSQFNEHRRLVGLTGPVIAHGSLRRFRRHVMTRECQTLPDPLEGLGGRSDGARQLVFVREGFVPSGRPRV